MAERWRPTLIVGAGETRIGVTEGGCWVVERSAGELVPVAARAYQPLLPILEGSRAAFLPMLEAKVAQAGLPPEVADSFPIGPLIRHGLTCGSDHWERLALEWAAAAPLDAETRDALRWTSVNGRTQAIRHGAIRLLRQNGLRPSNAPRRERGLLLDSG